MNPIVKCFCRIYQGVFHLALPLLPYREPKLYSSIEDIKDLLKKLNVRSVLLVSDAALKENRKPLEELLCDQGIHYALYDKTCANPTVWNVEEARELYLKENCEALIAFGGGSSMDCAKGVGARIAYPNKSLDRLKGLLRVLKKIPPLIAIPTTAGTGSEVTITAVITDSEKKHKYTMNSFTLIPSHAILDPKVTYSLPPHLTATTGMDALTHAVEAYIGNSTSKQTRRCSLEAVHLIFKNIEKAYTKGDDYEARKKMLHASYIAGIAFSKSYVGYIHAIAHSLGGQYNIPHGLANAVLMPYVLKDYGISAHKKLHELGIAAGVASENDSHEQGANKFIMAIENLNQKMNIPTKFEGILEEDIPVMARYAAKEANPLYPVPKLMNAKELEKFYYMVSIGGKNEH